MKTVPIIDLFAGPGGLGEGFTAHASGPTKFNVQLSLELDPVACSTLRLRKFFHLSKDSPARESYYAHVRGEISRDELALRHKDLWQKADAQVLNVELGATKTRLSVHQKIKAAVGGKEFVLIGGPPCQAYSLMGRSRRLGIGSKPTDSNEARNRKKLEAQFFNDPKHQLYKEYLEIIAVHRPAVFVMENVKGLGSARTGSDDTRGGMFDRIRADLEAPAQALEASMPKELTEEFGKPRRAKYRLFTLASGRGPGKNLFGTAPPRASDFILRSEDYGVPQARHRIIILGIREDIDQIPACLERKAAVSAREVLEDLPGLRSAVSRSDADWFSTVETAARRIPHAAQTELQIPKILGRMRAQVKQLTTGRPWVIQSPIKVTTGVMKWLVDTQLKGVLQHEARSHMASDLARYLYCAAFAAKNERSPSIEEWPIALRPAHQNIKTDRGKLQATGFSDRFKVQGVGSEDAGRPSSTVTSHIAKDGHYYIHFDPTQCRSLTVREAARLQTFPDNYFFCGNRTQQYHQVGNAVPPYLARQIAAVVAEIVAD